MENHLFAQLIFEQAKKYGDRRALMHRDVVTEPWKAISWNELAKHVLAVAKAFVELGLLETEHVAQFSQNRAENLIVDFALFANRGVVVPMYATSSVDQVDFIVKDASIKFIFVGDQQQYNIAHEVLMHSPTLKKIICFDQNVHLIDQEHDLYYDDFYVLGEKSSKHFEVEQRQHDVTESDLACILYTSGTTGNSKGVMLAHSCFNQAMRLNTQQLTSLNENDISIAFLPLSHVFERTWCYLCLNNGITIYINLLPSDIQLTIKEVHPTLMCAVPRFWEKVYIGVQENLSKFSPLMLGVVAWALATGKKYNVETLRLGKKPGLLLKLKYKVADKFIFSKVKATIGIENGNMFPTAGAKLSDDIALFFRSIGVPIVYGYGLTETTATVSCYDYTNYEIGSVGCILPGVEVKIGEDNEIMVKGKTVFTGYYNNPVATKAAFTDDGWFKTGDAGHLKDNHIYMTERIKDLFKTSNGKYIAPQEIETRLGMDKYIEQVAVIGDERNYVTAIIAPSISALEDYAAQQKIAYENIDDLLKSPQIYDMIYARIQQLQHGMAEFEKIKRFSLIKKSFTIETGELTNTLKIRRAFIMQKYKSLIEEMYARK
jgi:long-chain acyl-CoA synthetase